MALRQIRQVGIYGAGNAGIAEATRIKLQFPQIKVILYNRTTNEKSRRKVESLKANKVFHISGVYEGMAKPDLITIEPEKIISGSDLIIVTTTANAHGFIAQQMAPYLSDGQLILIFAGGIDSKFVMARELKEAGSTADVTFADADTFIHATKIVELSPSRVEVLIKASKNKLYLSALPSARLEEVLERLHETVYPDQFIGRADPLQTGIGDGPGLHIVGIIMQRERIENQEDFNFYLGLNTEMTEAIEELDRERILVAKALGIEECPTSRQFLNTAYDIPLTMDNRERTLYEMLQDQGTPYYNKPGEPIRSPAPKKMSHRYLYEEVMTRVVPLYYLAKALGVDTPLHKKIIEQASQILGRDYFQEGRNLAKLGLTEEDVRNWRRAKMRFENSF